MAKVNIDAYRVAGRPFRVAIEENATIGAQVGSNLTLSTSVTLLSGQVLPAGYVLQPVDLLNGLIVPPDGQGVPADWNQLTSIPANVQEVQALGTVGLVTRLTSGDWVTRQLVADPGVTISNSDGDTGNPTIGHADTSSVANFTSDNANGVVIQDLAVTFDTFGHVQTITAGTADVWTTPASSYRTLLQASSIITAGAAAGTYAMVAGGDGCVLSGAATALPVLSIYIDSADFPTIGTLAPKLRIRVQLYTNDTAPTGNYTFGLYPITRPATSGGSGVNIYTIGSVVAGSNGATFTAPAADGLLNAVGADFALPANGHYVIGVLTTAAPAANSNIQINAQLQMRNA